jgi:predicted HTH transcriptional regulator
METKHMAAIPSTDMPGHRRLAERVNLALDTCQEGQAVEFKESKEWRFLRWAITKTALAMGNLRDGGIIIVGASEGRDKWELTGINEDDLSTYKVDTVVDQVNAHVSPHVDLTVATHKKDERTFLVIYVAQFRDTPLVCKKDGGREVSEGTVYVRPPGKPESRKVLNANEMHELLELAADIRARQFLERMQRLQALPGSGPEKRFREELEGL